MDSGTGEQRAGGAVRTFLIADVRGFTHYTQEQGDDAASELATRFAGVAREVVPQFEGELVELRGDEALCVFASARQALRAAIALQRRFREPRAGEPVFPLGVGIGLDAGEAVPTDGGFRGKALNLAARLCAIAGPGEVLATASVVHLAHRVDGIRFVSRRSVHLKGVEEPVRLVEVRSVEDLPPVPSPLPRPKRWPPRPVLLGASISAIGAALLLGLLLPRVLGGSTAAGAFRPGTVLLDLKTRKQIAFLPPSQLASPAFPLYSGGHFWLANFKPNSFVEIDPTSGRVLAQFAPPSSTKDADTYTPYAVQGRAFWVGAADDLVKVDTGLQQVVDRLDLDKIVGQSGTAEGVAVGGGLVWVARDVGAGQIVAVDPNTAKLRYRFDGVVHHVDLAYSDGVVWTADSAGVDVIDPAANVVRPVRDIETLDPFEGTPAPTVVVAGGGFGWTTDPAKGILYKIDRNARVASYHTGVGAVAGSFSGGVLWVANQDEGTVTGIDAITGKPTTYRFDHPVGLAAAGGGILLAALQPGPTIEKRIDALSGKVARLFSQQGALGEGSEPALNLNEAAGQIAFATCATLLNYPDKPAPEGLQLRPEVAAAMPALSADRRTYTFTVRRGYRFSSPVDEPVTAQTFRYSIERALSAKLGEFQPGAFYVDEIEGEQAFRDGKARHISGLRVRGNRLSITLTKPSPDFLRRLALPSFCPVPIGTPAVAGAANVRLGGPDNVSIPSAGPYYVADWQNDKYVILKRNPYYHGPRPHVLDAIALREGVDAAVAVEQIDRAGWDGIVSSGHNGSLRLDPLLEPASTLASRYRRASSNGDQYRPVVLPETGYVALNAARGPFADRTVRRAAALALDRAAIAAVWGQVPSDQLLPPVMPGFRDRHFYPLERPALGKAVALMNGRRPSAVMVIGGGCEPCVREGQLVRADLGRIGLRVKVEVLEDPAALGEPGAKIDIIDGGLFGYLDGAGFLERVLSDTIPSPWLTSRVRHAVARVGRLSGKERESAAAALADRLVVRDIPVIAYGNRVQGEFFAPTLGCRVFPPASGGVDLAALCPRGGR
jgi:class 3 adenylate cyclase/ABC-type transport system substrate-binding protein